MPLSQSKKYSNSHLLEVVSGGERVADYRENPENLAILKSLLEGKEPADPNACFANGVTALQCAAFHGNNRMVELLLEKGAKVSTKDLAGETALDRALTKNKFSTIVTIAQHVLSLQQTQQNKSEYEALRDFLLDKDLISKDRETFITVLKDIKKKDSGLFQNMFYPELFISAAKKGDTEIVDLFQQFKIGDRYAWTALHQAVRVNNLAMVQKLLDKGADVSVRNKQGANALDIALSAKTYNNECVKTILTHLLKQPPNVAAQCLSYGAVENFDKINRCLGSRENGHLNQLDCGEFDKALLDIFNHCQKKKLKSGDSYQVAVNELLGWCVKAKLEFSEKGNMTSFQQKIGDAISIANKTLDKHRGVGGFFKPESQTKTAALLESLSSALTEQKLDEGGSALGFQSEL